MPSLVHALRNGHRDKSALNIVTLLVTIFPVPQGLHGPVPFSPAYLWEWNWARGYLFLSYFFPAMLWF